MCSCPALPRISRSPESATHAGMPMCTRCPTCVGGYLHEFENKQIHNEKPRRPLTPQHSLVGGRSKMVSSKVEQHVSFPLELDLSPYLSPGARPSSSSSSSTPLAYMYDLFAVVNHQVRLIVCAFFSAI